MGKQIGKRAVYGKPAHIVLSYLEDVGGIARKNSLFRFGGGFRVASLEGGDHFHFILGAVEIRNHLVD